MAREITYKINKRGCFECTSHKTDSFGYPRSGRVVDGIRFWIISHYMYYKHKGSIPKGLCVLHKCDNPKCINPNHLELGTLKENVRQRDTRGRTSREARTNGEINGMSKLTTSDIIKIRSLKGKLTQNKIASMFNISQTHVSGVQRGAYWRHL